MVLNQPLLKKIEDESIQSKKIESKGYQIHMVEFFDSLWIDYDDDIPNYFIIEKTNEKIKIRIGVSFKTNRNLKINDNNVGRLYYPLMFEKGFAGNGFSINAPFVLNTIRTELAPKNNRNFILLQHSAIFISKLFKEVLLHKFGISAYLLLKETGIHPQTVFLEKLYSSIKEKRSLPNNLYSIKKEFNIQDMFCDKDKYLPCKISIQDGEKGYDPALDLHGIINDNRCISNKIKDIDLLKLFISKLGVEPFTIHDVVSLKINDYVPANKLIQGWHFQSKSGFADEMSQKETQIAYANAINNHFKELSVEEINKLKTSYSWLTELGNLRPLKGKEQLFLWKGEIHDFLGLDKDNLVHHSIADLTLMKKLKATIYNINKMLTSVVLPKLEKGLLNHEEKTRLLDFIICNVKKLNKNTIKTLKMCKIFLDKNNRFVEFNRLIKSSNYELQVFGNAISFPNKKLLKSEPFLKRFRLRQKINPEDIIRRAESLFQDKTSPNIESVLLFESYLNNLKIRTNLEARLRVKMKIVCEDDICESPQIQRIYYPTKKMKNLIGNKVHYAKGKFKNLFKTVGVRFQPASIDIIEFISELCTSKLSPTNRSRIYTELVNALNREGIDPKSYMVTEIICIKNNYYKPRDVFLSHSFFNEFLGSKLYLNCKGKFRIALVKLGCRTHPKDEDYVDFLRWIGGKISKISRLEFEEKYLSLIYYAYSKIRTFSSIAYEDKVILTHAYQMVSQKEVANHQVFIDDEPQLSEQIKEKKFPIWFTNCGLRGYDFAEALQTPKLSESVILFAKNITSLSPTVNSAKKLLFNLQSQTVINAIESIIQQNTQFRNDLKTNNWIESIRELQEIKLAESIINIYKINNYEFSLNRDCCLENGTIYFSKDLHDSIMRDTLAIEVAKIILKTRSNQSSLADAIDRFLDGNILHYLKTRGYAFQKSIKKPKPVKKILVRGEQIETMDISALEKHDLLEEKKELSDHYEISKVIESPIQVDEEQFITINQDQKKNEEIATKLSKKDTIEIESTQVFDEEDKEITIERINPKEVETYPSTGWRGKGQKSAQRYRTADISYDWIIRLEKSEDPDCEPFDVSDNDLGYDIEIRKDGKITKAIEAKATSAANSPNKIIITPNEWRTAKKLGDLFWLYVVYDVTKSNANIEPELIKNKVKKFLNPYQLFKNSARFEKRVVRSYKKQIIVTLN